MLIATWNINSIKAHMEAARRWLAEAKPDVVCLQEIKCEDQAFPAAAMEELGYTAITNGQKTYNGVAILSRQQPEDVRRGLPGDPDDDHARYIEAVIPAPFGAVRVASIYLPNGNPPDSDKYLYKLAWMDRLAAHARDLLAHEEPLVLAGDYNIIPSPRDARNPEAWVNDALFLPRSRERFHAIVNLGFTDAVRAVMPDRTGLYSFWDYQAGAWQKDNGIRIDHLLLSPQAADRLKLARIDREPRGWERPSDHVPVVIDLG
jgi:exodeoxyribonuclease III